MSIELNWPVGTIRLTAGRDLGLRTPNRSDEPALVRACNDPAIATWTTVPAPYLASHAADFIDRAVPTARDNKVSLILAIVDAADDLLGMCSLHDVDATGRAGVGFWIAPWGRGQGAASRAVRALAHWAFTELGITSLCWMSLVGNLGSLRVALACGFAGEGTLKAAMEHRGEAVDCWTATLFPDSDLHGVFSRRECDLEIAAGAWQLQPVAEDEVPLAESLLPISLALTPAVWLVKEITTARPAAVVALLAAGDAGWLIAAPVTPEDRPAARTGRDAVERYARLGLGLEVD